MKIQTLTNPVTGDLMLMLSVAGKKYAQIIAINSQHALSADSTPTVAYKTFSFEEKIAAQKEEQPQETTLTTTLPSLEGQPKIPETQSDMNFAWQSITQQNQPQKQRIKWKNISWLLTLSLILSGIWVIANFQLFHKSYL